ncbi:MAG: hypothetical protein WBA98_13865 [Gordonia sp. (in: high G+C Gram-positive bacteria)]|uniref:hypothetical protein n=1 Tax=Gordonia sp. (in: high G+C Gram-positive bacteria) TaxID=84139 RepID=UPI003C75AD32
MTVYEIKIRESIERVAIVEVTGASVRCEDEFREQLLELAEDVAVECERFDRTIEVCEVSEVIGIDARLTVIRH